jgi:Flp pilus assembly protein TadG
MNRPIRNFAGDQGGASAIEFALILPVLFVLHIGTAEAMAAYEAQRNVAHMAAAIADLTAQSRTVTDAELNDILAASTSIIHPFPNVAIQRRISSFSANSSGSVSRDWSYSQTYTTPGNATAPTGYLLPNESIIVTDVIYDYQPTFGLFLPGSIRFTRHAYVRPRLSSKVDKL